MDTPIPLTVLEIKHLKARDKPYRAYDILGATNMTLTRLAIKNLKLREKPYRLADSYYCLSFEVIPSGNKLWRRRNKLNGKLQLVALRKFSDVTLEQARKDHDETRALVMEGKNPAREKKPKNCKQCTKVRIALFILHQYL